MSTSATSRPAWDASVAPSVHDPLGIMRPPAGTDASFARGLAALIDERIDHRLRNRTTSKLNGVPDMDMVHELIARGWAVYKPRAASEEQS